MAISKVFCRFSLTKITQHHVSFVVHEKITDFHLSKAGYRFMVISTVQNLEVDFPYQECRKWHRSLCIS